jgi:hypothetical protein
MEKKQHKLKNTGKIKAKTLESQKNRSTLGG